MSHSGGYPGFGSNMRWHPATGLAVIALGNGTYAAMHSLAELVSGAASPSAAPGRPGARPGLARRGRLGAGAGAPWPQTLAAAER